MDKVLFVLVLFFLFITSIPLIALADMHEIYTNPVQKCGLHCVIETIGFDTKDEAQQFWDKYKSIGGPGGHEPYKLNDSDLWFVDYQITEDEANLN